MALSVPSTRILNLAIFVTCVVTIRHRALSGACDAAFSLWARPDLYIRQLSFHGNLELPA